MSAKKISEFSAELRTRNIARPNLYHVSIMAPQSLLYYRNNTDLISMWCSGASTPQTSLLTNDNYIEAGVRRKYAYDQDWSDLTLTFYIDQDYEIKQFFDDWKSSIVPYNRNFNYPDSFTAESLILTIVNQADKDTYKYEFSRVVPKTVSPVELSYSNGNSISTFYVDFVFENYYYTKINAKTGEEEFTSKPANNTSEDPPMATEEEMLRIIEENNAAYDMTYAYPGETPII